MKQYVKPDLYYENFELSQHIAGCSLTMIGPNDPGDCYATGTIDGDRSEAWFVNGNISCLATADGYCYTNSSLNLMTINS